jgi:NADPH:quinone reductase-like Zn-dependent oxidoreductase
MVWSGVAAHKQAGARVIPLSLLTMGLLKLPSDGKRALTSTDFAKDNAWYRETLGNLLGWLAAGKLSPVVASRVPLVEAARAHG